MSFYKEFSEYNEKGRTQHLPSLVALNPLFVNTLPELLRDVSAIVADRVSLSS
jgi:hypothetical protein